MSDENSIKLNYPGREDSRNLIECIPKVRFKEVEVHGRSRAGGESWCNMLIYGDNQQVLGGLLKNPEIAGKVRLVYIDPPFATNSEFRSGKSRTSTISSSHEDKQAYSDTLTGAEYLEFLRKRLILLREIMSEDGSIYVHIDCKMGHYVKVLMDEVFGQNRFINDISRVKCNPKNFKRQGYGNIKDMVLFYSKSDKYVMNEAREKLTGKDLERLFPKTGKDGRRYTTNPLHAPGETRDGPTGQVWKGLKPPAGRHWRYPPDELNRLDAEGLIEWSSKGNPRKKIFADEAEKRGKKRQDIWEFKDPQYPTYPTEKNLDMLKVIIEASSLPGDLVLDCFAGSGSALQAAEEAGRKWIGVDNSRVAIDSAKSRISQLKNCSTFGLFEIERYNTD